MQNSLYFIGALLAVAGGALSFYFYGVYKEFLSGRQWWIPSLCRIDNRACIDIIETPFGSIAGVPNALSGTIFLFGYAYTLFGSYLGNIPVSIPFLMGMFTMFIGLYLVYGLVKLSAKCVVCLIVHALNLIIFTLQLISL